MIWKIIIGKSFSGCIDYCLGEKLQAAEDKHKQSRAEVLGYNQVFGDQRELIRQFNDVRKLYEKVSKPVLHITLSLAPGERLSTYKLEEVVRDFAATFQFANNQFLAIMHNDTKHQHLHIVANRIGFDGKTVSDSNNYKRMADFCRRMEQKHQLQKVLSPRRFQSKKDRNLQRNDTRKMLLKSDINFCLRTSHTYAEFEQKMRSLNYDVIKGRGIAFRDDKMVYTKGSEVGFSQATIDKVLRLKQGMEYNSYKHDLAIQNDKKTQHFPLLKKRLVPARAESKKLLLGKQNEQPRLMDESVDGHFLKKVQKKRRKSRGL